MHRSNFLLSLTTSLVPDVIGGDSLDLQIWYDLSDAATVSTTSGKITAIAGKGFASVHDANTSGAAARPTYLTASKNSLNTADFDGNSDFLTVNPFTDFDDSALGGIPAYTMFVVCKFDSTANQRLTETNATGTSDLGFGIDASGNYEYHVGGGTAHGQAADTNWHIHSFVFDGAQANGSELSARVDGTAVALTESSAIGDTALANTSSVYIGSTPSGTLWFDGQMGEIIVFTRALNASEVGSVNTYLASKWAV